MTDQNFRTYNFITDDGLTLQGRIYGQLQDRTPPVFCLCGLSRNSRDFHLFASRLHEQDIAVVTLDYRGRGLSDRDPTPSNYNVFREAQDVVLAMEHLGIESASFVGTSRGGLILHVLGGMIPERITSIVLNDIGPVIEIEGLQQIRDTLSTPRSYGSLRDAREGLKRSYGAEFTALMESDWHDMADAIFREIDGVWVQDFDPALLAPLRTMDFATPLPALWMEFDRLAAMPMLIVRGENSSLFTMETAGEMLRRHPGASMIVASGQGHAPLLHVEPVFTALNSFLLDAGG